MPGDSRFNDSEELENERTDSDAATVFLGAGLRFALQTGRKGKPAISRAFEAPQIMKLAPADQSTREFLDV
jgi:hypothetical protein